MITTHCFMEHADCEGAGKCHCNCYLCRAPEPAARDAESPWAPYLDEIRRRYPERSATEALLAEVQRLQLQVESPVCSCGCHSQGVLDAAARTEAAERRAVEAENLAGWRSIADEDARSAAIQAEDHSWMTREDLENHFVCGLVNWNLALDERDEAQRRATAAESLVEAWRPVLAWYADPETHRPLESHADGWCRDSGERARAALAAAPTQPAPDQAGGEP